MTPEHLLTLLDDEMSISSSVYKSFTENEYIVWFKIGAAVCEVKSVKELDSLIEILKTTKQEIKQMESEEHE